MKRLVYLILILPWIQEIKGVDTNEIIRNAQSKYKNQEDILKNYSFHTHLNVKATKKSGEILWEESVEQKIYVKGREKHTEIMSWAKNGKFLSPTELKTKENEINEEKAKEKEDVSFWPFRPGIEKYYEYKFLSEEEIKDSPCYKINVSPKEKNKDKNFYEGDFYLDKDTWGVAKAVYRNTKLPKLHKKMETEVYYEQIEPAIWLPTSKIIRSEVSAIVYKVDSDTKITYFDYKINQDMKAKGKPVCDFYFQIFLCRFVDGLLSL